MAPAKVIITSITLWIKDCIWETPPVDAVWAKAGDTARSEVKRTADNVIAFFILTPPFVQKNCPKAVVYKIQLITNNIRNKYEYVKGRNIANLFLL